ncbi:uncharacterized protein [Clytia hemisphaerica]|uniref:uncharacterized protein n=1 Tax=Clytia hemisphaerica TaxID=252671 RepID=UPI0034D69C8A
MTIYTGLQNYRVFKWVYDRIKKEAFLLKVVGKGTWKRKAVKNRKLTRENELFLTLVSLRMGLTEVDLAFRFKVAQSTVSSILKAWIPFLARQLEVLLRWPRKEEARASLPACFKKFPNTIAIIDCTEGKKKLISITPCGTISFISKAYGGSASDRFITEHCGILDKLLPGDAIMADKGFNIGDLVVGKGAKLILPPFLKDKGQFSKKNSDEGSDIAKARIHVERAIARVKDFKILQGALPITIKNKLDDVVIIICALTNLAPPLVV